MTVAGGDHAPGGGDTNLRLLKILILETYRSQHGTARCLLDTVDHDLRVFAKFFLGHVSTNLPLVLRGGSCLAVTGAVDELSNAAKIANIHQPVAHRITLWWLR